MGTRNIGITVTAEFVKSRVKTLDIPLTLSEHSIRNLLNDVRLKERLQLDAVDCIWEYLADQSTDEIFGLRAGLNIKLGDLGVVGFLLSSCDTFEHAIEDIIKHLSIVSETAHFSLTSSGDKCSLNYIPHYVRARRHRIEASIASTVRFAKLLTGGRFTPLSILLSHAPPSASSVSEAHSLLGCDVIYNQEVNAVVFHQDQLSLPIDNSNALVHERMLGLAKEVMERLPSSGFLSTVRGLVRRYPACGKNEIAKKLFISGRHLNRKLALDDTSFKQIQNEIRLQLAESWLQNNVHIDEIVERFSFCDVRSFSKAFKRWSGVTPAQFLVKSKS